MKTLGQKITILIFLTVLMGCNHNIANEFNAHSETTYYFETKQMPNEYVLQPLTDIDTEAKSAILINAATEEALFEKNIDQPLPIASMSKIMTELLVLEAIELGTLQWDEVITISDYAYLISNQPGYASVYLQQNQTYQVRDLFNAMAIRSANGATIALSEAVAGSEKEFVTLMNEKAEQLDLRHTHFVNSTGLTNRDLLDHHFTGALEDSNMMSAKDLALLTKYVINKFPGLLETTQEHSFKFSEKEFTNSNWMLPNLQNDWIEGDLSFIGVDGLKTGFTSEAGYGFTGTVLINNRRFISVIIGTENITDRFTETKHLYNELLTQLD